MHLTHTWRDFLQSLIDRFFFKTHYYLLYKTSYFHNRLLSGMLVCRQKFYLACIEFQNLQFATFFAQFQTISELYYSFFPPKSKVPIKKTKIWRALKCVPKIQNSALDVQIQTVFRYLENCRSRKVCSKTLKFLQTGHIDHFQNMLIEYPKDIF